MSMRRFAFFALLLLGQPAWADPMYKIVGADGKVTYTDVPPTTGPVQTLGNVRGRAPGPSDDPAAASVLVYTREIIVETGYRFCRDQVPASAASVREARDRWMEKHASLRAKKITVLHDLLSDRELRLLAAESERENEAILRQMAAAPFAQREQWCNKAPATFASPEFNLAGRPSLVAAVIGYKPK